MAIINRTDISLIANAMFDRALDWVDPDTAGNRWLVSSRSVFAKHQEAYIGYDEALGTLDSYIAQMDAEVARDDGLVSVAMALRTVAAIRELIAITNN